MGATLDLYIDTSSGALIDGGSVQGASIPTLTRNDSYTLRLRLLERSSGGTFKDIDYVGASLKAGIGDVEAIPSDGSFKLIINGVTSPAIPFNATAVCVYNAISNNVSTVSLYGGEAYGSYLLTASQPNTAMSFGANSFTLFPASSVLIGTRRFPSADTSAQQTIRLAKNPAVYSDQFTATPTAGQISLTKTQDGGANANETYVLTIRDLVKGGLYSFNFGGNSTTGIDPFAAAAGVQSSLAAVTGIGESNISVQENGAGGYTIQFVGSLGQTNIATSLVLDDSGIAFIPYKQTTLTLNTSELDDLFSESGESTITPTLEIELTQNGSPKTIYQGTVTIRKDLITTGSTVPGNQAEYYTKAEADALFIQDSATNINETTRELIDSLATESIGWNARKLYDINASEVLRWDSGLGFFGASAITRPSNTNVISALVNLGIISGSVTLGVTGGGGTGTTTFPTVCLGGTSISVFDGVNFEIGSTTGSKFATATTQKISFYGSTPIIQPTATNIVSALQNLGLVSTSVTLGVADIANAVTDWSGNISATTRFLSDTATTISLDWQNRVVKDSSAVTSLDWQNRIARDASAVTSIDWKNRGLLNSSGVTAFDYQNGIIGTGSAAVTISDPNIELSASYFIKHGTAEAFQILTTTASIYFGQVNSNSTNSVSVVVTGSAVNDIVAIGLPNGINNGLTFLGHVTTANGVEVDCVNATNGNITPATATYRIMVFNFS